MGRAVSVVNIRNVPEDTARQFKVQAAQYGMTMGQYLVLLVEREERERG